MLQKGPEPDKSQPSPAQPCPGRASPRGQWVRVIHPARNCDTVGLLKAARAGPGIQAAS